MADSHPIITPSAGHLDSAALMDGDLVKAVSLPYTAGAANAWVELESPRPFRAQAFALTAARTFPFGSSLPIGELPASQNGTDWITLVNLRGPAESLEKNAVNRPMPDSCQGQSTGIRTMRKRPRAHCACKRGHDAATSGA